MQQEKTEAQKHLDWCVERAMEELEAGSETNAIASFISDVGKDEGTKHILNNPMLILLLEAEVKRGPDNFKRFLEGFAV